MFVSEQDQLKRDFEDIKHLLKLVIKSQMLCIPERNIGETKKIAEDIVNETNLILKKSD